MILRVCFCCQTCHAESQNNSQSDCTTNRSLRRHLLSSHISWVLESGRARHRGATLALHRRVGIQA
jgi:hypothetical protein